MTINEKMNQYLLLEIDKEKLNDKEKLIYNIDILLLQFEVKCRGEQFGMQDKLREHIRDEILKLMNKKEKNFDKYS